MALPVAPRPYPEELPSSWLGRTAAWYDVSVAHLRQVLCPVDPNRTTRPDVGWDVREASCVAAGLRVAPEVVFSLELKRRWPNLAVDWLASPRGLCGRQRFGGHNKNNGYATRLRRAMGSLRVRNSPGASGFARCQR